MLAELVGWYTGRDENRRRYPRIKKDYDAEYSIGGDHWLPLHGVDLSGGGMCVVSEHLIANVTFDVRMNLNGRNVRLSVHPVWNTTTNYKGKLLPTYGLQFIRISAEDWEAMIQWITGDDPTKAEDHAAVHMNDFEVDHMIPADFRKRLLRELTSRSRFNPKAPLPVAFDYAGVAHHNGHAMHRLILHSKVKAASGEMRFSTRFLISESGEEVVVLT
ncbi:MAG: PilZ domain-containing protein [Candidatus Eremiobacteraeota bacterium]|nr:PilZ domain-containing protein [Candidatus Eremiobacteraeota bacterium]